MGTGLSDAEQAYANQALRDQFVPGTSPPPACLRVTGRERPDVWVKDPESSVVFEIKADVRMIWGRDYATAVTLRFPRVGGGGTTLCALCSVPTRGVR